jgi:superfamily II DNA or RNA helicase
LDRCIIFLEEKAFGEKILDSVHDLKPDFHTYYAEDDRQNLVRFANGELSCLITCHRVSQGIDIHSLRGVILLSANRAKLETIQRLGRCLRLDPDDPTKRAVVIDLVRVPEDGSGSNDTERADWLTKVSSTKKLVEL